MALPTIFAGLAAGNYPASLLDSNYNAIGNMAIQRCTATGTNTIVLTPLTNQNTVAAYANNLAFWFIASGTSTTSPVTIQFAALPALNAYRQDGTLAGSNDVILGAAYEAYYVSTLNSGAGGLILVQTPSVAPAFSSISGYIPSSIAGTSTTATLTVSTGQATDSTNASYIIKSTTTSWAVTNGNAANGYQGGTTLPTSATIDFYIISGSSGQAVFSVQNGTALVLPSGYTLSRFIFSLTTTGAGALNADVFNEINGGGLQVYFLAQANLTLSATTSAQLAAITNVPLGRKREVQLHAGVNTNILVGILITSPDETAILPTISGTTNFNGGVGYNLAASTTNFNSSSLRKLTNTSGQLRYQANTAVSISIVPEGFIDFRRS